MNSKLPDYSGTNDRAITVYCWSRTEPNSSLWREAETLGSLAAKSGFSIITGGYCGSMEAVSKGAKEAIDAGVASTAAGASKPEVVGVVVSGVFPDRVRHGNPYLTVTKDSSSMMNRIEQLTSLSRYYVVLPGTLGTLQELCCIWVQKLLHPRHMDVPVVLCFRDPWEKCLKGIAECLDLPKEQINLIQFVDSAEEAMKIIEADAAQQAK